MDMIMLGVSTIALMAGFAGGYILSAKKDTGLQARINQSEKEIASSAAYGASLKEQLESAAQEKRQLAIELSQYRDKAVSLEAQKDALDERLKQQHDALTQMQEQLKLTFQATAAKMLEDMGTKFSAQSEKKLGDLLTPMQERMNDFKTLVVESFTKQGNEQHTLKSVIEKIVLQTDNLSNALRGNVKAQGNWGEVMLERILDESGLRKDTDYVLQASGMGLEGSDGGKQRPDVIVNLPDNKHIIIDAKVSLTSYERYSSESEPELKAGHLKDFLRSVRAHVNGLELRRYQDNEKLKTPDFVLLFMPVEGAYSLAVQEDRELHSYAWGKRIVIVCPATLFATLRTVASLWNIERQNKNAQKIAAEAALMYDKFYGFIEDMNRIGNQLGALQGTYDDAFNKLSKGRGNLVGKAEKLREYGATPAKSLLKVIKDGGNDLELEEAESYSEG